MFMKRTLFLGVLALLILVPVLDEKLSENMLNEYREVKYAEASLHLTYTPSLKSFAIYQLRNRIISYREGEYLVLYIKPGDVVGKVETNKTFYYQSALIGINEKLKSKFEELKNLSVLYDFSGDDGYIEEIHELLLHSDIPHLYQEKLRIEKALGIWAVRVVSSVTTSLAVLPFVVALFYYIVGDLFTPLLIEVTSREAKTVKLMLAVLLALILVFGISSYTQCHRCSKKHMSAVALFENITVRAHEGFYERFTYQVTLNNESFEYLKLVLPKLNITSYDVVYHSYVRILMTRKEAEEFIGNLSKLTEVKFVSRYSPFDDCIEKEELALNVSKYAFEMGYLSSEAFEKLKALILEKRGEYRAEKKRLENKVILKLYFS